MTSNGFSVEIYDRNFEPAGTRGLRLEVERYSAAAVGGPEEAQLRAWGDETGLWDVLDWLRYWVIIRNENHTAVWWGYLAEAEVTLPVMAVGMSVEAVRNKVRVAYTLRAADGSQERGTTAWLEDAPSQAKYGVHEETLSIGDVASVAVAEARRWTYLQQRRYPVRNLRMEKGEVGARLVCRGLWSTLGWRSYTTDVGLIQNDVSTDMEHLLGWELADSYAIGMKRNLWSIHDLEARLGNLAVGDRVVVTGTGGNDGTYTIVGTPGDDETAVEYTSDQIYFELEDDVLDGNFGLSWARVDEMIRITDSTSNDQFCWVAKAVGPEQFEIRDGTITAEAANTVTLRQGHHVRTVERPPALGVTVPGAGTVTVTAAGAKIAQSFYVETGFTAYEVLVRVGKRGSPSDNLRLSIYSNTGGSPGTPNAQVATATVAGSTVSESMGWMLWTLGTPVALSSSTHYWIVLERTGAAAVDAYVVGLEGAMSYWQGVAKVWDGSAWVSRWAEGDLAFRVWGEEETTTQVETILDEAGVWFSSVEIVDASGVTGRQYRDAGLTAQTEAEELLEAGTDNGLRLLARVTPERIAQIYEEPEAGETDLQLDAAGRLRLATGPVLEAGVLPAGKWIRMAMMPTSAGAATDVAPVMIERAEYAPGEGRYTMLEPRSAGPW